MQKYDYSQSAEKYALYKENIAYANLHLRSWLFPIKKKKPYQPNYQPAYFWLTPLTNIIYIHSNIYTPKKNTYFEYLPTLVINIQMFITIINFNNFNH